MAKELLGYGYTNANGVATLDYDANDNPLSPSGYRGTGAGEITISAEALVGGETISGSYDITDTPSQEQLLFVANKSVLSYVDSDSATLTATYLEGGEPVSGETVTMKVYDSTQSSLLDTLTVTDNSDGTYTASYSSGGVGDIVIVAECGLLSQTVTMEDCTYYNPNSITSNTTLNKDMPTGNWELSFKVKRPSSSGNVSYIQLNNNERIVSLVGQVGGAGINSFRCYTSSSDFTSKEIDNTPQGTEATLKLVKEGTSFTYSMGSSSNSMTCSQIFSKLYSILTSGGNYVKELKIKSLPTPLSLSANKSVLSYVDSDTCTLTATYDTGETVQLYDSDDTLIGTMTDNNDGTYTYSYSSTGAGDIGFYAKCGNKVSETVEIEDCYKYGFKTTDTFHSINSSSSMTVSDGVATGYNQLTDFNIPMSSDFEISIDYQCSSNEGGLIIADLTNTNNFDKDCYQILTQNQSEGIKFTGYTGTSRTFLKNLSSSQGLNQWNTLKIVKQSGQISAYFNGTLIGTNTVLNNDIANLCIGMYRWSSNITQSMKNIKVKSLDPVPSDLSVTSDKSVLSYADSDSATITATLLDSSDVPISGETVQLYDNDDTLIGTMTDNNDGTYSYTYNSQGIGDIELYAKTGNITSETITIEDCTYYNTNSYSDPGHTFNVALPTHFTLEYVLKQTNSNYSAPYVDIGDSTNNRMLVGQYARAGANGLVIYKSSSTTHTYSTNPTLNQENTIWFKYDGTKYYYKLNNGTVMEVADANVTLTKLIHSETASGGYLKNIKIKPL